ncbi:MAG TPA: zinc-ribbon and DUF3426 domain-containing protein [Burkholderiaceae bacterium]|nr:zinc-ribbon and DUF3426 domain-containing protein [Burkholderiaceae bacterium]
MELTTKCPQCQTIFRASLEQLQLRKGYVRCVHCAHIFDGYEAVVPAEDAPADAPDESSDTLMASDRVPPVAPPSASERPTQRSPARREFTISDLTATPADKDHPTGIPLHIVGMADGEPSTEPVIGADDSTDEHLSAEPGFTVDDQPLDAGADIPAFRADRKPPLANMASGDSHDADYGHPAVRWVWQAMILAGLLIFLVQLIIVFRVQIAGTMPATRPMLERLCGEVGCRVAYSRQIDHIHIVRSALKAAPDPDQEGSQDDDKAAAEDQDGDARQDDTPTADSAFTLEITLRNDYAKAQEWPDLALELTDAAGARIARRNVAAREYLPSSVAQKPFHAMSEQDIILPLSLRGLNVNGFKLRPFFP